MREEKQRLERRLAKKRRIHDFLRDKFLFSTRVPTKSSISEIEEVRAADNKTKKKRFCKRPP